MPFFSHFASNVFSFFSLSIFFHSSIVAHPLRSFRIAVSRFSPSFFLRLLTFRSFVFCFVVIYPLRALFRSSLAFLVTLLFSASSFAFMIMGILFSFQSCHFGFPASWSNCAFRLLVTCVVFLLLADYFCLIWIGFRISLWIHATFLFSLVCFFILFATYSFSISFYSFSCP